jgi:DNA-binding CsgD family transcriptional regulator
MQAADSALQAVDAGLVALSPGGRVRLMTPCAKRMLAEFFGGRFLSACHLPEEVTHWVRDQKKQFAPNRLPQPLRPLVVPREGAELVVRLLPDSSQDLLLIQVCGHAINLPRLKEKGLTKREIEVLACVTKGKTNEEVGQHLEIRPRTVQKHLEHIFVKLGVETRTAAAAFALG